MHAAATHAEAWYTYTNIDFARCRKRFLTRNTLGRLGGDSTSHDPPSAQKKNKFGHNNNIAVAYRTARVTTPDHQTRHGTVAAQIIT